MTIEQIQEFFYLFYSQTLFLLTAVVLVVSVFLAIAMIVKAIDESFSE